MGLQEAGLSPVGPPEQRRIRPWSTQQVVPTSGGRVWFKANCPDLSFEPALQRLLARLAPGRVDTPIAVEASRGWMLTWDRGDTLAKRHEPTLAEWCEIVQEAGDVQRRAASAREQVLSTGVHDCSPKTVPDRFDALLARYAALEVDHPSHVTAGQLKQFQAVRPAVIDAAAAWSSPPYPRRSTTETCTPATCSSWTVVFASSTSGTPSGPPHPRSSAQCGDGSPAGHTTHGGRSSPLMRRSGVT